MSDFSSTTEQEINAIARHLEGKVPDVAVLAARAIASGASVESFRRDALSRLSEARAVTSSMSTSLFDNVRPNDWRKYSLSRAIRMQLGDNREKRDGMEAEFDQEIAMKNGKRAQGLWIPDEVFSRNLVAGTPTLGGHMVETSLASGEFIAILRNKSCVLNLGARMLNLTNTSVLPRQNGAGTGNWVGETVASTITNISLQQLTLTPQAVSAFHQYSKMLLMESNPSIDGIVRDDITQTLALEIDRVALFGSGSGQPTGIALTSGVGSIALSANGLAINNATAFPALVSLESTVAGANSDIGSLAYLMRPSIRGKLRTTQRFASTDSPVWDPRTPLTPVNSYRAEVSNQIANNLSVGSASTITTSVFFGNWNDLLIASFGSTDLVADIYTGAANGIVRLYARRWVDCGLRHPSSMCMLTGILDG